MDEATNNDEKPIGRGPGPWLIWSNEHTAWWCPAWNGYTRNVAKAGRYDYAEARKICDGACHPKWTENKSDIDVDPYEVMVPAPEMLANIEAVREMLAHS